MFEEPNEHVSHLYRVFKKKKKVMAPILSAFNIKAESMGGDAR